MPPPNVHFPSVALRGCPTAASAQSLQSQLLVGFGFSRQGNHFGQSFRHMSNRFIGVLKNLDCPVIMCVYLSSTQLNFLPV